MHFSKRAVLSIIRQPGKTLILFLIILIAGNLIGGVVAARQAISQSEKIVKLSLGATVALGVDNQALMSAYEAGEKPEVHSLSAELIEELGQRTEVRSFDYNLVSSLGSRSLENYTPKNTPLGEMQDYESDFTAHFILHGIRYAPIMPIEEGRLSLMEGRVFDKADIDEGRLVALVSDKVAEINNLHVGDAVVLVNEVLDYSASKDNQEGKLVDSHDVVLEIIGIFALNSGTETPLTDGAAPKVNLNDPTFGYGVYNAMYVPIKVAQAEDLFVMECRRKIAEKAGDSFQAEEYEPSYTPLYMLNSIEDVESFTRAAFEMLPEYYRVLSPQSQFEQIAGIMADIQWTMTMALIAAVVTALVVISLLVVLFLRDRCKEFGTYLSLGVRKSAIIGQVLLEVLLVAALALIISLFTGNFVSDSLSQQLITDQLISQQEFGPSSYVSGDTSLLLGDLSLEGVLSNYQVSLSASYVFTFLGLGVGVTALSCIVPLLYVLRLRPKNILM